MLEVLQFVFSSFWIWLGFVIMLWIVMYSVLLLVTNVIASMRH